MKKQNAPVKKKLGPPFRMSGGKNVSIRLSDEDRRFLDDQKRKYRFKTKSDVVRTMIESERAKSRP